MNDLGIFSSGYVVGMIIGLWAHGRDIRRALNRKGYYIGPKYVIRGKSYPPKPQADGGGDE